MGGWEEGRRGRCAEERGEGRGEGREDGRRRCGGRCGRLKNEVQRRRCNEPRCWGEGERWVWVRALLVPCAVLDTCFSRSAVAAPPSSTPPLRCAAQPPSCAGGLCFESAPPPSRGGTGGGGRGGRGGWGWGWRTDQAPWCWRGLEAWMEVSCRATWREMVGALSVITHE